MTKQKPTTLVLRTCFKSRRSYGGFQWPETGHVAAADWNSEPICGGGLHGLPWGVGSVSYLHTEPDAKWLVVAVPTEDIVMIDGDKCKFPSGNVVFCGDRKGAIDYMDANGAIAHATCYSQRSSGNYGTSTSGYGGTSTSGEYGTSTSGNYGTSTSGDSGTSTSGDSGTSTSGYDGTSTSGYGGTSTSGEYGTSTSGAGGTSTSGEYGTSTSGNYGTSTSGYDGTSTSGAGGTSTSGEYGTSTSGAGGIIVGRWWDAKANRYRLVVGYVGEDGIEAGKEYRLDMVDHKWVEVPKS